MNRKGFFLLSAAAVAFRSADGFATSMEQKHRRPDSALFVASRKTTTTEMNMKKTTSKTSKTAKQSSSLFVSTTADQIQGEELEREASNPLDRLLSGYFGPRAVLALTACVYGTNFPLGAMMNDALPASAATCARMVVASMALSPFMGQLRPSLRLPAVLCGCFTATGYITQSLALVDTSPATVSFLGTATVLVCPFLEWLVDKKPMSLRDAPQTWLAACLCLAGVAALELFDGGVSTSVGAGDALALVQAVGFGTGVYLSEKMVREDPSQALPITSALVATTALLSSIWCLADGWMFADAGWRAFALPQMFFEPSLRLVAAAVVWTGLVSTALNFFVEVSALGRVPSSEASIILATEPMWAALFAAAVLHEQFGINDYVGGLLMVLACLANSMSPTDFEGILGKEDGE